MDNNQLKLIIKTKKYFTLCNDDKYSPEFDNTLYPSSYSNSIGSYFLNKIGLNKKFDFFNNLIIILKDIFYSLNYINHSIYYNKNFKDYNKIVITWAFKDNFDKQGNLNDRYFNVNSNKEKKTLWFVIYMSDKIPKIIGKNLVIFKKDTNKSVNIFKIFKTIFKNLIFLVKNFYYFLFAISNHNYFSQILIKKLKPFINSNLKYLIMPYEGQPFQNKIISFIKINKVKIKTIGYIHSPPLALPTNFIHKVFSPDKIIVNGIDQYYCFNKILGWKKSKIKLLPSFRFLKKKKLKSNSIYLPISIRDENLVLNSLKYLNDNEFINIRNFSVRNHPAATGSKKNTKLIQMIYSLKKKTNKKNIKKNFSVFIGTSGGIIEALERGLRVIQIVETPIFDVYSKKIWPSIIKKKLNNNIYIYSVRKNGNLIKLGTKKKNLKSILN